MISRRHALAAGIAGVACCPASAETDSFRVDGNLVFLPLGPNASRYGAAQGFPVRSPIDEVENRVGAFSHFDELLPTRRIERAAEPWSFRRSEASIHYTSDGARLSLADYISRNPVTGLLIARGDDILFEHYQYGRTDRDRLASQSIAKSITGLLVGIAISEGAIRSVDDAAETYVPAFRGTEYGRTSLRDLLHMSSGVAFGEEADDGRDLKRLWFDLMGGYRSEYAGLAKGTTGGIVQFNHRIAPPGTRFFYASIEADVLAVVLHQAVGRSASRYLQEKIW